MKDLNFVGTALKDLCAFPTPVKKEAGHQLMAVQFGGEPDDWKSMPSIGQGVREIRLRDEDGQYRVVYVAKFQDVVYVLHAFHKKSQRTAKMDIDLARKRYNQIREESK